MGTYHELICQQVLSPVSVYPKATDDDWALHHPQLPVASEDPQVAAGIRQAVDHCALQLCKTRVHSTTVHCNCTIGNVAEKSIYKGYWRRARALQLSYAQTG